MHQDKLPREPSMKLSHVVVLSIIGMLTTSLSVLVFTSPRQISQDALTSNETEIVPVFPPSPGPTPTPNLRLALEPEPASVATPQTNATAKTASSIAHEDHEALGPLQLTAVDEPCSFSIDGESVTVQNNMPLMVQIGSRKVKCERPNGNVSETVVEVVEDQISTVSF